MQYQPWKCSTLSPHNPLPHPPTPPPPASDSISWNKKWIVIGFCSLWGSSVDQYVLDVLMALIWKKLHKNHKILRLDCELLFGVLFLIRSNTKLLSKKRWEAVSAAKKGKCAVNYSQIWLCSHTAAPLQNFPRPGEAGYPFDRNSVFVNGVCSAWHDI